VRKVGTALGHSSLTASPLPPYGTRTLRDLYPRLSADPKFRWHHGPTPAKLRGTKVDGESEPAVLKRGKTRRE